MARIAPRLNVLLAACALLAATTTAFILPAPAAPARAITILMAVRRLQGSDDRNVFSLGARS